jgi:hypothetical protein
MIIRFFMLIVPRHTKSPARSSMEMEAYRKAAFDSWYRSRESCRFVSSLAASNDRNATGMPSKTTERRS